MKTEGFSAQVKEIPFLQSMPDEVVEKFCGIAAFERFNDGDIVFREGDPADSFYMILEGEAFALKEIGREKQEYKSIGILSQGDIFGQIGERQGSVRFITLKAKGSLVTMKVSQEELVKFMEEDREMATRFLLEFIQYLFDIVRFLTAEQIALYETGRLIASGRSQDELIRDIVPIITRGAPSADSGFIAIYNYFNDEFEIRAGRDSKGYPFTKTTFSHDEALVKQLISEGRFLEGNPSRDQAIWDNAFVQALAVLCYPILSGEKLMGFITLFSTEKENAFTADQKNFLIGICNMLAPALEATEFKKEDERRQRLDKFMY
ncbi:MAG: cyclic nucleotide-binding domain-containing protein [Candidatus Eremiobacteraeota bacterium]|nr:cyclic nucleotide-binding domain-containing protein [Candidatus Eremiobacteraeota bacterium]